VRERRHAVEPRAAGRDRQVAGAPEVARAGVVGLDLERLARLHPEERLVPPVEGVLPGLLARDPLHRGLSPAVDATWGGRLDAIPNRPWLRRRGKSVRASLLTLERLQPQAHPHCSVQAGRGGGVRGGLRPVAAGAACPGEAAVAVGGERLHAELLAERERLTEPILGLRQVVSTRRELAKEPERR